MRDTLPHACFIGITDTPVGPTDKNTGAAFDDYLIADDIQRATSSWPCYGRSVIHFLGAATFVVQAGHDSAAI